MINCWWGLKLKENRKMMARSRCRGLFTSWLAVTLCLFVGNSSVTGQEQPYWRDTVTGRLYWNKNKPLYLFLSPTPDAAAGELMQSQRMPQYACPFYLDTEGINFLRTRWAVDTATKRPISPQREILWEVYADGLPPTTRTVVVGKSTKQNTGWKLGDGGGVELTSTDAGCGVADIYYSLDGATWERYSGVIHLSEESLFTLRYYAVDHVGNREQERSIDLQADLTPPSSRCVVTGAFLESSGTVSTSSVLHLESSDHGVGVEQLHYRIDDGQWNTTKPGARVQISTLKEGDHTLEFYGVDYVGNKEEVQSFSFYLDKTPPITISDVLGDKFIVDDKVYFSGRSKMKITAVDNKAGVKAVRYSIDGDEFKPYEEPFYMPNKPGWHVVRYYSVDSLENQTEGLYADEYYEYRMKVDKVYVDLTGPRISFSVEGDRYARNDTVYLSPRSRIKLSGEDSESGLQKLTYTLNHDAWEKQYDEPFSLEGLPSGEHYAEFFAYDRVNNRNVKTLTFFLDSESPKADYRISVESLNQDEQSPIYPCDAKIYLTSQDDLTGVELLEYSLNGKALQPYRGAFGGLEAGTNRLKVKATDRVGNSGETVWNIECR